jgi:hypothetical protein
VFLANKTVGTNSRKSEYTGESVKDNNVSRCIRQQRRKIRRFSCQHHIQMSWFSFHFHLSLLHWSHAKWIREININFIIAIFLMQQSHYKFLLQFTNNNNNNKWANVRQNSLSFLFHPTRSLEWITLFSPSVSRWHLSFAHLLAAATSIASAHHNISPYRSIEKK